MEPQQKPPSDILSKCVKGYYLAELIGSGNYGKVYKAVKDGTIYAIKIIERKSLEGSGTKKKRMRQLLRTEISVMKRINSPYVVKLYDVFQTANRIYLVMEYCDEPTLRVLMDEGLLSNDQAIAVIKQIVAGLSVNTVFYLQALHCLPVIHRDLKPDNILRSKGRFKIGDLGFARILEHVNSIATTMLGTPIYMAPEIVFQKQYNLKVDFWSLGVLFYQMIFGKPPYQYKSNNNAHMRAVLQETVVDYDSVNLPKATVDFIKSCLQQNPDDRITWSEMKKHPIFEENVFRSTEVWDSPDFSILPIPIKTFTEDDFSFFEAEETSIAIFPSQGSDLVTKIVSVPKGALPPTLPLIPQTTERQEAPETDRKVEVEEPQQAEMNLIEIIDKQRKQREMFDRHSAQIMYQKNRLLLLMNYVVKIGDRIAQDIFSKSRKLTEIRLLVCKQCVKKVDLLSGIFLRNENKLDFDNFEKYTKSEKFEMIRKQIQGIDDRIRMMQDQITRQHQELTSSFKHRFLDFFISRSEQERRSIMVNGEEEKDYTLDGVTVFTEELIKKVCHKFTDGHIRPSFSMYMFIWAARRYRELTLDTEHEEETKEEVEKMFHQVDSLERSFSDWRKKIDDIAREING